MSRKKATRRSTAESPAIRLVTSVPQHEPEAAVSVPEDEIAFRAYLKWMGRGCPIGDGSGDWLAAEAELVRERSVAANLNATG